jgi:hypothetical protein
MTGYRPSAGMTGLMVNLDSLLTALMDDMVVFWNYFFASEFGVGSTILVSVFRSV